MATITIKDFRMNRDLDGKAGLRIEVPEAPRESMVGSGLMFLHR